MKLEKFYRAVSIIKSYLNKRSQAVSIREETSSLLQTSRGVPQGSVLGPLLFTLYINDLPSVLKHSHIHLYADDVQLCVSFNQNDILSGFHNMNDDLSRVYEWASGNELSLNPTKTKSIVFTRQKIDITIFPHVIINGCIV